MFKVGVGAKVYSRRRFLKVVADISGIRVSAKFTSKLILARLVHRANENIA